MSPFSGEIGEITHPRPKVEIWAFPAKKDAMGISGGLVKMEGVRSGGNSTIVYFGSKDCTTEYGRVRKSGGKTDREKMSSANTASSLSRWTPRATCSACTRWSDLSCPPHLGKM